MLSNIKQPIELKELIYQIEHELLENLESSPLLSIIENIELEISFTVQINQITS